MSTTGVPFVDLAAPHQQLREELVGVFRSALKTAGFIGGPMVEGFERDFAKAVGTRYCAAVGSGTDALRFMLMAAGIRKGDLVITVPNTFIATTEAISQAGGRPQFVDVSAETYNLDPAKLQEHIATRCYVSQKTGELMHRQLRRRVAAIVPVHLYGQMANMDAVLTIANRYGVPVFEDACQAHGAEYFSAQEGRWMCAGSVGLAAAFSFYPGKNLGACGEGGAVTTNDEGLAQQIRMLRDHGQAKKYHHEIEGYNGRMDAIQAGILQVKLRQLAQWNASRREAAAQYQELLEPVGYQIRLPFVPAWSRPVHHLYVVGVDGRDALQEHLNQNHIGTGIHYPIPLHLQKAYSRLGYRRGDFPVTESAATRILSLPMFPSLSADQQRVVAGHVRSFVESKPARVFAAGGGTF